MKSGRQTMQTELLCIDDIPLQEVAETAARVLRGGGICILPTDTIYGIVALEQFASTVRRIYSIKRRPHSKPFIILIGSMVTLRHYTKQELPEVLKTYWPGPLTIIFRGLGRHTVALRFPDDPLLGEIFSRIGDTGLVAPSANISGEENLFNCDTLIETFDGQVDLIVCSRKRPVSLQASTIVDITKKPWHILRQGSLDIEVQGLDQKLHSEGNSKGEM
jgi:L-threonylcarbamoyladenylate synthase